MKLAVIGSGYVGLVASACFAEIGHEVTCMDVDLYKIQHLNSGTVPIHESGLPELIAKHLDNRRLTFTTDLKTALCGAKAVFIAVGTPAAEHGEADLSYVEAVAREVARTAPDGYKVIVEKSTVPVLTHSRIRQVMLLNGAPADSFDVASNPEFLREGTAVADFLCPDRIVLGVDNERSEAVLQNIYASLTSGCYYHDNTFTFGYVPPPRVIVTSAKSAELIKHASNAFLATKISFANAVADICEAVGADAEQVLEGVGADSRIGSAFLKPGIGYGGSCFPKDLKAFQAVARDCGCDFKMLDEVASINDGQVRRFIHKVKSALWTLRGKRLAVLGLAFKGETDDVRESPAIAIVKILLENGATVFAHDPAAMERAKPLLQPDGGIFYCPNPYMAMEGADALLILTDWKEYAHLDLNSVMRLLHYPIIVDGRNLYSPAAVKKFGFDYYSVGRSLLRTAENPASVGGFKQTMPDS